ncbi:inactive tyrosine-protein kinase PEAK1 [Spea bombifrons]|uniref:inactive tyrosine-protein kinase PEAK1 n=1 Tax=Spea bombifrons TaxID=233779 RepID=UPI00234B2D3E|nr:inactive tyrosine-protein kinase PEAK1 [Spea bombifrons]XP_053321139.1 inactive tyrosine-protein kinase PEAK1 [Spea bombifrons]XP_053321140.1 inactive tyrosine-protein kinase PEAK1 [Spea bombifrons]
MSACGSFTEHVWKPGECKNCFQPKGQHQLAALGRGNTGQPPPPPPPPPPYRANHAKVNSSQRPRATTGFRPPVAKKPTIAVKPTMMAVDGAVCHPAQVQARAPPTSTRIHSQTPPVVCGDDQANNNAGVEQVISNNNHMDSSGLTEVLKEIAGLGSPSSHLPPPEGTARETFLCRINQCYRRSLERKPSASCLSGSRHEGGGEKKTERRVALSGEEGAVIGRDGGRFCYPEFSSGEESWDEEFQAETGERESWEESDEELLAMEIRMRGQPRFANLQGGSLSPVPAHFRGREKWNTVPLRQKSLQRVCAVDYDDSYDEILNGCDVDGDVTAISPSPDPSLSESLSCPPSTSSSSSSGGLFCNGVMSSAKNEDVTQDVTIQEAIQDTAIAQAKPYSVVSLEQPVCKPYTIVDVSAAMAGEGPPLPSTRLKKESSTRYQEVWTSSTSPRQKLAKTDAVEAPKRSCHKSAPTSPTAGLSAHTVPVRSPNLSEIKFNSYNNAGMPPFPIIIHDEPEYAHSCKSADKVPILINPSAYDNLAIYRSFVGAGGVFPPPPDKEKRQTSSLSSNTYEEIETPAKGQQKEDPKEDTTPEVTSCPRESANRVLSQIVASIHPPRSPPEAVILEPTTNEEQRPPEPQPDACIHQGSLGRPKSLFPLQSEQVGTLSFSKTSSAPSSEDSPTVPVNTEPLPPFPPPRSTSSPYHASMLHKHFATRGKPTGTNRPSPTECSTQPRRPADGKPRRWISFKSFFRRKKEGSGQGAGEERGEDGKLLGLDGTVIHMLPPPPVQHHQWFSESRGEPGEKPAIVFMYRPEEELLASSPQDSVCTETRSSSTPDDSSAQDTPSAGFSTRTLPPPDEQIGTDTVSPPVSAEMQNRDEPGTASDCSSDCSPGGVTYTNLGKSRAAMIPYKQPRQTLGGSPPQDPETHPTPPPLPKKTPRQATPEKTPSYPLNLANPTYDTERSWEAGGSESGDSLKKTKRSGSQIAELQTQALRRFYARCEDVFMAGQREPISFGLESWPDFRLISPTPCCQAGDAVYYRASYARDPGNLYSVKICRNKAKQAQREYYHCLAVRQGLSEHFNIQQDCGHFLAEVPARLLPWEDPTVSEEEEEEEEGEQEDEDISASSESKPKPNKNQKPSASMNQGSLGKRRSRVVVITREPPRQTLADFVREGEVRHRREPEIYERQVCLLLLQLCGALEHLKAQGITHCDLRLDNLLLASCRPSESGCSCCRSNATEDQSEHGTVEQRAVSTCAGRLLLTNFNQAKLKSQGAWRPQGLGDPSRLAPEIVGATQYRRSDEFQAGILIYEMLHLPNPFLDGGLKDREYGPRDLPAVPRRSPYSRGLGRLAGLLLQHSPSDRLQVGQAKAALRCLIWGPRDEVLQGPEALQNWLEVKRTLLLIRLAERALEREGGVGLEDWMCCQYLAFGTAQGLAQTLQLLEQH